MKKQLLTGLLLIAGCASSGGLFGETVGEKFRKALANVDSFCKRYKMGPYLDRNDPESLRRAGSTSCEVLKIKPFDLNAVLATPEGKFAYSIQLPPPLDKPRVRRGDYRSAEEYFEALCGKEHGDYVFRSAENVEVIAQLRPSPNLRYYGNRLSSFSEEFVGGLDIAYTHEPESYLVDPRLKRYRYLEAVTSYDDKGLPIRYVRFNQTPTERKSSFDARFSADLIQKSAARYGYLWRGTENLNSRNEGIVGGELVILELETSAVIAVRRVFGMDDIDLRIQDRVAIGGKTCASRKLDGFPFITSVVKPTSSR